MHASKTPLLAAIALAVLWAAAGAVAGDAPDAESTADEVLAWFRDSGGDVRGSSYAVTLAAIPFFVLAACVRRALPSPHGFAFLAASGAVAAQTAVWLWFHAGLALHADTLDPATAQALFDVSLFYGPALTASIAVMAGAVALASLKERALPAWLGWFSAAFAVEQLAESLTIYGESGFAAPGGDWNLMLGGGLFLAWVLALGFALSRRPLPAP